MSLYLSKKEEARIEALIEEEQRKHREEFTKKERASLSHKFKKVILDERRILAERRACKRQLQAESVKSTYSWGVSRPPRQMALR